MCLSPGNRLTPFAGCPTLSSSEEEEEDEDEGAPLALADFDLADEEFASMQQQQQHAFESQASACRLKSHSMAMTNSRMVQQQQQQDTRPKQHHFNHDNQNYNQQASRSSSRQQQHLFQVPTSINITAPSPMGSVRDISRASLASSTGTEGSLPSNSQHRHSAAFSTIGRQAQQDEHASSDHLRQIHREQQVGAIKRHSHQDVTNLADSTEYLVEQTRQMNLASSPQQLPKQQRHHQRKSPAVAPAPATDQDPDWLRSEADEAPPDERSRSKLIDELLKTINDDSFNEIVDLNNKLNAYAKTATSELDLINAQRPKSAIGQIGSAGQAASESKPNSRYGNQTQIADTTSRPRTLNLNSASQASNRYQARGSVCVTGGQQSSTFDNVIRRMSTNLVQNFTKMSGSTLGSGDNQAGTESISSQNLRREKSNQSTYMNNLFVDTSQVPARRHSDNTINVPRIQVALSSPSSTNSGSRSNLNQRASVSASKLANKWKLSAKSNQRETSDKLSPNLGGALGYMRRHSSGNTTNGNASANSSSKGDVQSQSNGGLGAHLLNASPFKQAKSSSNLGLDFLLSNRSMKRRCSAASMLGHQTQRKAEDLLDAGMKSVQNMFS